jgi:hypothetical protein
VETVCYCAVIRIGALSRDLAKVKPPAGLGRGKGTSTRADMVIGKRAALKAAGIGTSTPTPTDCFRAGERATVLGWEETMPDNALDDLMETLSIELGERLQAATGKRLHFALIAADHLEARVMATNSSASAVKVLAEMLRVMAADLGRRH